MSIKLGYLLTAYFILINLAAFLVMGIDKRRAKKGAFRISEVSLFALALLGGANGSSMGMLLFHHKTNHWYFQLFIPLFAFVQCLALLLCLLFQLGWM